MTKRLRFMLPLLLLLACGLVPLPAVAGPITYFATFTATGTVNGTPFDGTVIFSLTSDTNSIIQNGNIFQTPNGVAGVSIQGVGAGTFTDPFDVFDNQGNGVAGFTDVNIEDIVDLSNSAFFTYNLKTPIGPLDSTYFFVDSGAALGSTLGTIIISSVSGTPTFAATVSGTTPEPATFALLGSGLLGLAALRRRLRL